MTTMYKDLAGQTFGTLTVLSEYGRNPRGEVKWLCKCSCGRQRAVSSYYLRKRTTDRCNCEVLHEPKKKGEVGLNILYNVYKFNAVNRGLEFNLTKEQLQEITSSNCHYCNIEPNRECKQKRVSVETLEYSKYVYNGIDRKNNTIGYIINNCLPCCAECNRAKRDMSYEEFLNLVKKIYVNRVEQSTTSIYT